MGWKKLNQAVTQLRQAHKMNRLPTEIANQIWFMSGCYRDMNQYNLHKIRMRTVMRELRSVRDPAHTCYSSKGCNQYTHFFKEYAMVGTRSECCDWMRYRRKKLELAVKWRLKITKDVNIAYGVWC